MTPRAGSLRLRLLAATLATLLLALAGAHWWLAGLFREHVLGQFDATLAEQLDQLTARLEFDAQGRPQLAARGMSDPRWDKPYSGLYWQVQPLDGGGAVLRSRSLWDAELRLPADPLADGTLHRHRLAGPRGEALRVLERSLQAPEPAVSRWRLAVAGDLQATAAAADHFDGVLAASLAGLGLLLALAALAQVAVGLAPLRTMRAGLQRVREGRDPRLEGRFPAEVQPLIDDFNAVLERNAEVVARARAQAGNLAHALKTPLAVLGQAAGREGPSALAALVQEQVAAAERQLQWHLARARAAAAGPGRRTPVEPVLSGLLRTMDKLHAARRLDLGADVAPGLAFAGESQDLQEMLGNLLDNACRSARGAVMVSAARQGAQLQVTVEDDGPGIAPAQREAALQRGVRLDESRPGHGLGLAIVVELAGLYGGGLELGSAAAGGLSARLTLPAAG